MISIPLYLTVEHPCAYLANLSAQSALIDDQFPMSIPIYTQLLAKGFRRSGNQVYAPHCQNCNQCIATRIVSAEFTPNRSQRRCLNTNISIKANIKSCVYDAEHGELYKRYVRLRHPETAAREAGENYLEFFTSHWCKTWMVEFRDQEKLLAVTVVDVLNNALSAVYTFFDPEYSHLGLGNYAVLWQINKAKELGMEHVYLGYWIAECQKMNYKQNYQPLQGLVDNQWTEI